MSYAAHQAHAHAVRPAVRYAVLTVSDSRDLATDDSGRRIEERMAAHENLGRLVARDDAAKIRAAARRLLARKPDVLIVNGGTGLGPRDVTIETLRGWFEKEMPGFGERFRSLSTEQIGTGAWLSRATAGTLRQGRRIVLMFLLPGSPAACDLAVERLILPEIAHAVSIAQGVRPHG